MSPDINEIFKRTPIFLIAIGVVLILIGAMGGLPIGDQLQIVNSTWEIILAILGGVFILIGIFLIILEYTQKSKSRTGGTSTLKFDTPGEALNYILEKMKSAKKNIYDLTWEKPLETTVIFDNVDRDKYLRLIEEKSKSIRYREIIMFRGSEARVAKAKRLIVTAGKYYELVAYPDPPEKSPPKWQFIIIDDEVILHNLKENLVVRQKEIVNYYRNYYDDLWINGIRIKGSDDDENDAGNRLDSFLE